MVDESAAACEQVEWSMGFTLEADLNTPRSRRNRPFDALLEKR
jgi:hypothetical protein